MSEEKWGWYAGDSPESYQVGPFDTKQQAINEAQSAGYTTDFETESGWVRKVFFAEHCGTYYDCNECGSVARACKDCSDFMNWDEPRAYFTSTRNEGCATLEGLATKRGEDHG